MRVEEGEPGQRGHHIGGRASREISQTARASRTTTTSGRMSMMAVGIAYARLDQLQRPLCLALPNMAWLLSFFPGQIINIAAFLFFLSSVSSTDDAHDDAWTQIAATVQQTCASVTFHSLATA